MAASAYGFTSSFNVIGDYDSIATAIVGSGGQSTITFSSIPSTYKHLQVRFIARGLSANVVIARFNSDATSNYSYHSLIGRGDAVVTSMGSPANNISLFPNQVMTAASTFSVGVIDVLDYSNANKYKTLRTLNGGDSNGGGAIQIQGGFWRNTTAITSITLTHNGTGFAQYSHFALYGIK